MVGALLALAAACSPAAKAKTVQVEATDFSFTAPASLSAGLVTWELKNTGKQLHHLALVRLEPGKTMADLQKFLSQPPGAQSGPPPFAEAGGAQAVNPGGATSVTQVLQEGAYALVCFVPDFSDGVPHFAKGMVKELTVTGKAGTAKLPQAKATVNLKDFAFEMPKLSAGKLAVHVVNRGPQSHEWVLVQLAPGKTPDAFLGWVGAAMAGKVEGPPPGQFVGGGPNMASGKEVVVNLDLKAGSYVALCFIEDPKTGKPHAALGMVQPFTIQ